MKNYKMYLLALLSTATLVLAACGNSGNGSSPTGYFPTYPGSITGSGSGEGDIVLSYFGKSRIGSTEAVKNMLKGFLPDWQNGNTGIFQVSEFYFNSIPEYCTEWAFFKPSCAANFSGYLAAAACDYPWEIYGGPQDCSSYNNDQMGIWFEQKSNGMLRVRLMANADTLTIIGSTYFGMITFDDIDPDDTEYVQSINNGDGLQITLRGIAGGASFNKIIVIKLDDVTNVDADSDSINVSVQYGTVNSLNSMFSPRMNKQPLL